MDVTDATSESPSRRRVLSALATFAVPTLSTGCLTWDQPGASDVIVYNLTADRATLSIVIAATEETDPHTARTLEVARGEKVDPVNRGKLPLNASYTVDVVVEGGASATFEWTDPTLDLAPLYVVVEEPQHIEFLFHAG